MDIFIIFKIFNTVPIVPAACWAATFVPFLAFLKPSIPQVRLTNSLPKRKFLYWNIYCKKRKNQNS